MLPSRASLLLLGMFLCMPSMVRAELRFTHTKAELGEIRGGPTYQHRFEFVNDSAETITILDVRLGCGCLQPVIDQRVYQPGEKGSLLMHVRTLGQAPGQRTWQARLQYREKEKLHETDLIIAATLRNEVTVEPSIIVMSVETTLRQEVIITDHRDRPGKVIAATATSSALSVRLLPQEKGVTRIILEVSREALTKAHQEEILRISLEDPSYRDMQVPVTLMKSSRQAVNATPERIEFRGTASSSRIVRLRGVGDQKVTIAQVSTDHPGLRCTWAAGPGNDATLRISMDAPLFDSSRTSAVVHVHLTSPTATVLSIPVDMQKE